MGAICRETNRWKRIGSDGEFYTIRYYDTVDVGEDSWTCTCKDYYFKSKRYHEYLCKHIREIQESKFDDNETTIYASENTSSQIHF